jgi:K+-transporting ATPase KdpF subunit
MDWTEVLAASIAVLLAAYLLVALLKPEVIS